MLVHDDAAKIFADVTFSEEFAELLYSGVTRTVQSLLHQRRQRIGIHLLELGLQASADVLNGERDIADDRRGFSRRERSHPVFFEFLGCGIAVVHPREERCGRLSTRRSVLRGR